MKNTQREKPRSVPFFLFEDITYKEFKKTFFSPFASFASSDVGTTKFRLKLQIHSYKQVIKLYEVVQLRDSVSEKVNHKL